MIFFKINFSLLFLPAVSEQTVISLFLLQSSIFCAAQSYFPGCLWGKQCRQALPASYHMCWDVQIPWKQIRDLCGFRLNVHLFQAQVSKESRKKALTLTNRPTEKERKLHLLRQCSQGEVPEWELSATAPHTHSLADGT